MKTKNKISAYILRSAAWAVFLSVSFGALSWAFHSVGATGGSETTAKIASQPRTCSFAERVAFQRAIEEVYWRHRIWPEENPDPKPALDAVMSQAQLEKKVENYLRDSVLLEDYWHTPITAEQLQVEMARMARDTKQPEVLRELFEALGNDPAVIAECLARPVLAERLIAEFSGQDKTRQFESPPTAVLRAISVPTTSEQVVYTLPTIADACSDDTWAATSTTNAPTGRQAYTTVWTGAEMIVWGGIDNGITELNTGGRYNPATDVWTDTDIRSAPEARKYHIAIWTGTEMIIWGGYHNIEFPPHILSSGARYNPVTNSWTATGGNAPGERALHTAVWTGSEMIVWGGAYLTSVNYEIEWADLSDGGRYNPSTDSWTVTSTTNMPAARRNHIGVWTGSEMIVWGGLTGGFPIIYFNSGGRYNPSSNSWTATTTANAPTPRDSHTAVWTGNEMIVWGGYSHDTHYPHWFNTGGRYNPASNSWVPTYTANAPSARNGHTAVWTGSEMIIWGGSDDSGYLNTGGRYSPGSDNWTTTSTTNAPTAGHTAVWTGSEMIIWGGVGAGNTGGRYCAQSGPTGPPVSYDFNADSHPDYALYNASTHLTTLWYLNNNVYVNGRYGPSVPNGWALVAVGDFNGDGRPDYVLYNSTTHQTAIWYMNNNLHIDSAQGPTLNARWTLVAAADFNRDGHPDYLLFDPTTHATLIYYMNNNVGRYWRSGPTLNARWSLVGAADFNKDGHPDYLLFDPTTHATLIYYMNNNVGLYWRSSPTLNARWNLIGAADFNRDGHPDYLLFDPTTRATLIYYMNNNVGLWWTSGPTLTAGWSLVAP